MIFSSMESFISGAGTISSRGLLDVAGLARERFGRRVLLVALPLLLAACPDPGNGPGSVPGCGHSGYFCPEGFECNEETGQCECTPGACIEGSVCDVQTGECVGATDDYCPDGYAFSMDAMACVCASDECCPPDYAYDTSQEMCACTLDICCPPGFEVDAEGRCICQSDDACGEGFFCDPQTGDCRCTDNDACEEGAFCNDFGFCQGKAACTSSFDCPDGQVCDPAEGFCMSGYCAIDADCPLGRICRNNACHRGCRTDDDCWIAQACIDDYCRGGICNRDAQCGVGEYCADDGTCVRAQGAYCHQPCTSDANCAGDAKCVSWMVEGEPESFCAPECGEGNWCPAGFSCGGTYSQCIPFVIDDCPSHGLECVSVTIHNEPDITHMCGEDGEPRPIWRTCGPITGSCADFPGPNQTARPGLGQRCDTLCRDDLICANVGDGYRCYPECASGQCPGADRCQPAANGVDMVCAP